MHTDNETLLMDILDTADGSSVGDSVLAGHSAMRDHYLRTGQGFVLVYDITSASSFEYAQMVYQEYVDLKAERVDQQAYEGQR